MRLSPTRAPTLAEDLRNQIREQMKAGKSDKEIVAYLTQRYGKFILYNPTDRSKLRTCWVRTFCSITRGGLFVLFRYLKQRRELITDQPLSGDERRRAETLLNTDQGKTVMILFWLICAGLVAIALAFVLPTLLLRAPVSDDRDKERAKRPKSIAIKSLS